MQSQIKLEASQQKATERVYRSWREGFIISLLIGVLLFGAVALLPALNASESIVIDGIFISTYIVVALTTIFKFTYNIRATAFLMSVYILGIGELISLGILGDGLFYFIALVVFATMLISPRAGIVSIVVSVLTFIVVGWLMINGGF